MPRWRRSRFGDALDLVAGNRWLGNVGPEIGGECRYAISGRDGGAAPTQAAAKAVVEQACIHGWQPPAILPVPTADAPLPGTPDGAQPGPAGLAMEGRERARQSAP